MHPKRSVAPLSIAAMAIVIALLAIASGGPVGTASASSHSQAIADCGAFIEVSGNYHLEADLVATGDTTCITVIGGNVTIEGNGWTMHGADAGQAILAMGEMPLSLTVRNLTITGWESGVGLESVDAATLDNVTVANLNHTDAPTAPEGVAVHVTGSGDVLLRDVQVDGAHTAFNVGTTTGAVITGATISDSEFGVTATSSPDVVVADSTVTDVSIYPIEVVDSPRAIVHGNTVERMGINRTEVGYYVANNPDAVVSGNTDQGSEIGFHVIGATATGNRVTGNTATGNAFGYLIGWGADDAVVENNAAAGSSDTAFLFDGSADNLVAQNNTATTSAKGFHVRSVINALLRNSTAADNGYGFIWDGSSGALEESVATGNDVGVYLFSTGQISITGGAVRDSASHDIITQHNDPLTVTGLALDNEVVDGTFTDVALNSTATPFWTHPGHRDVGIHLETTSWGPGTDLDLVIHYTDAHVAGLDEATLLPWRLNETTETWDPLGASVDVAANTITIPNAPAGHVAPMVEDAGVLTGCAVITASGDYHLDGPLTIGETVDGCLRLRSSNVTVDGAGHELTGPGAGTAVDVRHATGGVLTNVTVGGFAPTGWATAVSLTGVNGGAVHNVTADDNGIGVLLNGVTDVRVVDNTLRGGDDGVHVTGSDGSLVARNTLEDQGRHAVDVNGGSTLTVLRDNAALRTGVAAFRLNAVGDTLLEGNSVTTAPVGVLLRAAPGTILRGIAVADAQWLLDAGSPTVTVEGLAASGATLDLTGEDVRVGLADVAPSPPAGHASVGSVFEFEPSARMDPSWLNVSLRYDGNVPAYQEPTLQWWRHDGVSWAPVEGHNVAHTDEDRVETYLSSFSTYAVFGEVDDTAPETQHHVEGAVGLNGWHTSPVIVMLEAIDDLSGVATTEYRLNGGAWQTYEAPFNLTDGQWLLEYRSVDNAGNLEAVQEATLRVDTTPPATGLTVSGEASGDAFVDPVSVTLDASDDGSGVNITRYRLNDGEWKTYEGPFSLPLGRTNITYHSQDAAGNTEDTRTREVRVVEPAPEPRDPTFRVTDAAVAPTDVAPGEGVVITATVHNDGPGAGTHNLAVRPGDGVVRFIPVSLAEGESREVSMDHAYDDPGVYTVTVDDAPAGTVTVQAPPEEVPENETIEEEPPVQPDNKRSGGGGGGGGHNDAGGSGDGTPVEAAEHNPVTLRIVPVEDEGGNRSLLVQVENAPDASRVVLVVRDQSGNEVELARGGEEATWNTSGWENGVYTVEAREESDDGARTMATQSYVVKNPLVSQQAATAAVVAGAVIMVTGASAGTAAAGRVVDVFEVFARTIRRRLNVEFRDRTKALMAFLAPGSATSAVLAASILAITATYVRLPAWHPPGFLAALPVFGLAAVIGAVAWLGSDYLFARLTGDAPHYRFHGAGAIAVLTTTIAFRSPFGIPGYVDKGAPHPRPGWTEEGVTAFRGVAHLGALAAFFPLFIGAGRLWSYQFGEAGTLTLIMLLVSSVVPVKPFAGHALWRWNKAAAGAVLGAALVLYYVFQLSLAPDGFYVGLGVVGLATAAGFIHLFRPGAVAQEARE